MKHANQFRKALFIVVCLLQCWVMGSAQLVRPRKPTEPAIKTEEKPYTTASTPATRAAMIESSIRNVRVTRDAQNITISFNAVPDRVPIVELAKVQPKVGADGVLAFPSGSGSVARPAGGDKAKGEYIVDMNQELETGAMYYYIISTTRENGMRDQITGNFPYPANFLIRYRGFICEAKTDGPGSDEIYAIVSASFPDGFGRPRTITTRHPHVIVEDVGSGDVHGDPGRDVYQGGAPSLVLTVTLMEHDGGNPDDYRNAVDGAVVGAYGALLLSNPPLLIGELLTGAKLAGVTLTVSEAIQRALKPEDDVIGAVTRVFTVGELVNMANHPSSFEQGIQYNFFTEHRGYGGRYRVYFDVSPK